MTDRIKLSVVCTDKGQHPGTSLGDLTADPNGGMVRANFGFTYAELATRRKGECVWLDQLVRGRPEYRVHMRCPRCRRHVQWGHDRVVEYLPQLNAAGLVQLDISHMQS